MQQWNNLTEVPSDFGPAAITMGCFDGVHLGHQSLLSYLRGVAADKKVRSVVVTFDPLPVQLHRPKARKANIMCLADRLRALAATGIDGALILSYTPELAHQLPGRFVEQVLVDTLKAAAVVVGEDCRFGRGRAGGPATLKKIGAVRNFTVDVLKDRLAEGVDGLEGRRLSSTWIREALSVGDVTTARRIMGRAHRVHAVLEKIPEQNVPTVQAFRTWVASEGSIQGLLPKTGEFAGWVIHSVTGRRLPAVILVHEPNPHGPQHSLQLQIPGNKDSIDSFVNGHTVEVEFSYRP